MHPSQQTLSTRSTQHHRHRQRRHHQHTLWCRSRLNTAYDSDGISNLGDEEITLSDASSQQSTSNYRLDSNTTGTINTNTVNTSSGAAADLNTYDSEHQQPW